jgi:hypothetical protein
MTPAEIPVFTDEPGKVKIPRTEDEAHLFPGLTTAAGMGRLPDIGLQLSAARTP